MIHNVLNDILDYRYATPYNLASPKASTLESSLVQIRKDIHRLLAAGYIAKVDQGIPTKEYMKRQFYKVMEPGAEFVNRHEDWRKLEKKASSSIEHESAKIDVCAAFKRLYGVRKFEFNVIIGEHKPDIIIHEPFKLFVEIEIKDNQSKVIQTINKWKSAERTPVFIVYCPWGYSPLKRFQEQKPFDYQIADKELLKLIAVAKKAKVTDRFLFTHHIYYNRLNEKVWHTAQGARYSLEAYGKAKNLIR